MTPNSPQAAQPVPQLDESSPSPVEAERTALVVLGMHRSGTSAITRVVSLLGADLPSRLMRPKEGDNEAGFWESQAAYELNDAILSSGGSRWDDWRRFNPNWLRSPTASGFKEKALDLLDREFGPSRLFVLKDPRICRLFPFWREALEAFGARLKCILTLRNPMEVAASLGRRDGFSPPKSYMLWLRHVLEAEHESRGVTRTFIAYDDLIRDWRELVTPLANDLELAWPRRSDTADVEIDRFLSESHRHHRIDAASLRHHPEIADWVKDATESLQRLLVDPESSKAQQSLDDIRMDFDRASDALGAVLRAEEIARDEAQKLAKSHAAATETAVLKLKEREKQVTALEQELASREAIREKLRCNVEEGNVRIVELEKRVSEHEQSLQAAETITRELRNALSSRDERIKQLLKTIAGKDAAIAEWGRTVDGYKSKLDEHAGRIAKLGELNGQREEQTQKLEQNAANRERIIEQLTKTVKDQDKRIRDAKNIADSQNGELSKLKAAHVAQRTENSKLRVQRNRALHRLHEVQYPRSLGGAAPALPPRQCFGTKLSRRERLYLRKRANYLLDHKLLDSSWYIETYPNVVFDGADPIWHWLVIGWQDGFDPNPFFDTKWYLKNNEDVAKAAINPLFHYLKYGCKEGRDPSPLFATNWYLQQNPDVAKAKVNPLVHYLKYGHSEGRAPKPASKQQSGAGSGVESRNESVRSVQLPSTSPSIRALQVTPEHLAAASAVLNDKSVGSFSIILPTWNRRKTIERSIDSVLAQSFTDWELIICDDGGEDGTDTLVKKRYGARLAAGQIRYLKLDHMGVSAARNAGLRAAHSEWIAYLDSDNAWHPDYLLITAAGYAQEPHRRTAYGGIFVHDSANEREFARCQEFDWGRLLKQNYIDLNVFSHHCSVFDQLGGFDETLTRLVDWDLILRYTKLYEPKLTRLLLADYFVSHSLNNITLSQPLNSNEAAVRRKYSTAVARYGATPLRLAYVLWDWPALSQTFVLEELRELISRGIDVRVYYAIDPDKAAQDLPEVVATRVDDADDLAKQISADQRNWIHSHFAYPAVTKLVWPAAEKSGIAFSFMPHAVDIFHFGNRERNRVGEVTQSALCAKVMVHGEHHRRFLIEQGALAAKIIMTPQAVNTEAIRAESVRVRERQAGDGLRVLAIARYIEKKGIEDLISAVALLDRDLMEVRIFGYGPLEDRYREQIQQQDLQDSISMRGMFEGADALAATMDWADVFCLPCVEAENGDVDGMPTVFFEAMAAGLPCVAGAVSAIPDFITDGVNGFLVPPRDPAGLARKLTRLADMPAAALAAIAETARDWVDEHVSSRHTVDALLDSCASPPLEIFMVTYHRDEYGDWSATNRAIRSVLERTTTPFVLTIVDNGSEARFVDQLRDVARSDERVRLIELGENRCCGPASNVALEMAKSEFVFYICSNEGYVARNGWERVCLRYMRNRPKVAMAGGLVSSPSWPDGEGYMRQEWFSDFRNPSFAELNPGRPFSHVQGGLWVLRRSVYESEGGFSARRPQEQTDVEYSFYLESLGYELGDIPGLVVLSNKTRPGVKAFLDERVLAVHPVFDETRELVDECAHGEASRCNICGWMGEVERYADGVSFDCPECDSSPRDRAVFRWLAGSDLHHRDITLEGSELGKAVKNELGKMFKIVEAGAAVTTTGNIPGAPSRMLGIPPLSLRPKEFSTVPTTLGLPADRKPRCNICGCTEFSPGPGGRLSPEKGLPPRCTQCQSLERHRAFRAALELLRGDDFQSMQALQFSEDRAVDPTWFSKHEVSVWGGSNSLDLQAINRPDASYDVVICNHVIEHVADDRAAMQELFRIIRPSGFIFLSFPDPLRRRTTREWGFPDESKHGHYRIYGCDVFDILSEHLPNAVIVNAIAADPVTGTDEMYFLIGKDRSRVTALASRLPRSRAIRSRPVAL